MNAQDRQSFTLDVLNQLRTAERRSLLPRLAELDVFIQEALAHELDQVRRMIAEQAKHDAWLLEAAERCDVSLSPASADVHTANLHYLDLGSLLPRVIACTNVLVQIYGQAQAGADDLLPPAAEAIARMHNRHQIHLEQLREIQARLQATQTA
jgi:hypothetical protein